MRDVLSAPVRTLPEDAGIDKAVALFRAGSCRRIPVVDAGGKVVGILSLDDVLVLLAEQLGLIAGLVEREAPHPESPGR
jgi:CBS-domain-containing membrane protein